MRIVVALIVVALSALPAGSQVFDAAICDDPAALDTIAREAKGIPKAQLQAVLDQHCAAVRRARAALPAPRPLTLKWPVAKCRPASDIRVHFAAYTVPQTHDAAAGLAAVEQACARLPAEPAGLPDGHRGPLAAAAYLPDGALVSAGTDGTLRHWPGASGPPRTLWSAAGRLSALATSPDGKLVAVSGFETKPTVVEVATGRVLSTLGTGAVAYGEAVLAFAPDGGSVYAVAAGGTIGRFEATTGRIRMRHAGFPYGLAAMALSSDGRVAAALTSTGEYRIFATEDDRTLAAGKLDRDAGRAAAFDPAGRRVAFGMQGGIEIHDVQTGRKARSLPMPDAKPGQRINGITFLDESRLVGCGPSIDVYDLGSGRAVRQLGRLPFACWSLSVSPDRGRLAVAHDDADIRLFDLVTGTAVAGLGAATPPDLEVTIPLRR